MTQVCVHENGINDILRYCIIQPYNCSAIIALCLRKYLSGCVELVMGSFFSTLCTLWAVMHCRLLSNRKGSLSKIVFSTSFGLQQNEI